MNVGELKEFLEVLKLNGDEEIVISLKHEHYNYSIFRALSFEHNPEKNCIFIRNFEDEDK